MFRLRPRPQTLPSDNDRNIKLPATLPDALQQCRNLFVTLAAVGDFTPFGALQGIAGLGCIIIDSVTLIRGLKSDCLSLANKAAHAISAIVREALNGEMTVEMRSRVDALTSVLTDIRDLFIKLASLKWYSRYLKQTQLQGLIAGNADRLNDACSTFQITTLVDVHRLIADVMIRQDSFQQTLINRHDALSQTLDTISNRIATNAVVEEVKSFSDRELVLLSAFRQEAGQPTVFRAELNERGKCVPVVVKTFPVDELARFRRDLERLRKIYHSNIPTLLGQIPGRRALVISNDSSCNALEYLDSARDRGNVDGFMTALSILQGVASGLQYLRTELQLGTQDLQSCTEASEFHVGSCGQVLIGHEIMETEAVALQASSADLDKWLKEAFWRLTSVLIFKGNNTINYGDWATIERATSHLYPFTSLVAFLPTFCDLLKRLTGLQESLSKPYKSGTLTYRTIRSNMLRLKGLSLSHMYYPPSPLDITIGDVGYMEGNTFVKLHNIREDYLGGDHPFDVYDGSQFDYVRCSSPFVTDSTENGTLRHVFTDPLHVAIHRHKESLDVQDELSILEYLRDHALAIIDTYGRDHNKCEPHDLIIISGISTDRRRAGAEFFVMDGAPSPLVVEFVEKLTPLPEESWGEWIINDRVYPYTEGHPERYSIHVGDWLEVKVQFMRQLQHIHYLQLHQEDFGA